jgi:hypothetical protein
MKKKEEELCREIEEQMKKKRKSRESTKVPEKSCRPHPPLTLGSKHFKMSVPRPDEVGYAPIDNLGTYKLNTGQKITFQQKYNELGNRKEEKRCNSCQV